MSARYTILLRTLLNDKECQELIDEAMNTYPMYEAKNALTYALIPTRSELNRKILNAYKYREIAFESVGRFIDELKTTLEEIMPTYYSMYKSIDMMNEIDDIFGNINITETTEETGTGSSSGTTSGTTSNTTTSEGSDKSDTESDTTSSSNSSGTSHSKDVTSDTPQSELSITAENIDSVDYASSATWHKDSTTASEQGTTAGTSSTTATSESSSTSSGNTAGTAENQSQTKLSRTYHKEGNQGVNTYAHDLVEFRTLFQNVEQMIINDMRLQELFMMVY